MKIALIIPSLAKGGAERAVSNLSLIMSKEHEVFVVVLDGHRQQYPYGGNLVDLETPHSHTVLGKVYTLLKRAYLLRKLFKKERFDGIFAFMEAAGLPAVIASKDTCVSVRDTPESLAGLYPQLIRLLYPRAKKIITVSRAIEQKLILDYGFNDDSIDHSEQYKKTKTIYNMVDINKVTQLSLLSTRDAVIPARFILAVGRLEKQKGFDLLIESYAKSKVRSAVSLIILGEGSQRQDLEKKVAYYQLDNQVIFFGNTDNPFVFYSKAEFLVLPSRHEGFPNILIEALACHCPCIATDCQTGPNEIIIPNQNGILVETENIAQLTRAMDRLYFDRTLKESLRKKAQDSVRHLSPEVISAEWIALIDE